MPLFLLTVALISLSGVMMPGPVLAATIAKSGGSKFAGSYIALGHGLVEFPLMFAIYFGLYNFFQNNLIKITLGLVGGVVLIYMGKGIFNLKKEAEITIKDNNTSTSTLTGAITSMLNPYFILWWVTVGTALIMRSALFGLLGLILFGVVHWLCDFIWYSSVSYGVYRSGEIWGKKVQIVLLGISSLLLIGFGTWFIISSFKWIT
ncbi:LysE family transporter [Candidatus Aerophobetes bacterium]|nr:LysE family transporter [Candidatus Aerophobetes bacterium]